MKPNLLSLDIAVCSGRGSSVREPTQPPRERSDIVLWYYSDSRARRGSTAMRLATA